MSKVNTELIVIWLSHGGNTIIYMSSNNYEYSI